MRYIILFIILIFLILKILSGKKYKFNELFEEDNTTLNTNNNSNNTN